MLWGRTIQVPEELEEEIVQTSNSKNMSENSIIIIAIKKGLREI